MIYLIASIFVYLLVALALGVAAGWLWRDMQAAKEAAAVRRKVKESRARLPQMEEAIRARDERFEVVRHEYNEREDELAATKATLTRTQDALSKRESRIAELERNCAEMERRLGSIEEPGHAHESAESGGSESQTPHADIQALEEALAAARGELEQFQRALTAEQRRVEELTRERELQRRSLEALEQQLELARESQRRTASQS